MELFERILDRRRRLSDTTHAYGRAVGDEQQFVAPALAVGGGAGDVSHLLGGEIAGLAAEAGGGLLGRHRQPVDLGAVLGVEQHAVDRQLVGIVVGALAVLAGERHDVIVISGIVDRDREIDPALVTMSVGDRLAGEGAAGNLQRLAVAGHQRQQVDKGGLLPGRIVDGNRRGRLGKTRACQEDQGGDEGSSEDGAAEAHRKAHMPGNDRKVPSDNQRTVNWLRSRLFCRTRLKYHRATPTAIRPYRPTHSRPALAVRPVFFSWRGYPIAARQRVSRKDGRRCRRASSRARARGRAPLRMRATTKVSSINSRWAWLPPRRTTSSRTGASICTHAA